MLVVSWKSDLNTYFDWVAQVHETGKRYSVGVVPNEDGFGVQFAVSCGPVRKSDIFFFFSFFPSVARFWDACPYKSKILEY